MGSIEVEVVAAWQGRLAPKAVFEPDPGRGSVEIASQQQSQGASGQHEGGTEVLESIPVGAFSLRRRQHLGEAGDRFRRGLSPDAEDMYFSLIQ